MASEPLVHGRYRLTVPGAAIRAKISLPTPWRLLLLSSMLCSTLLIIACKPDAAIAYTTPIIPVTFSINSDWQVSVTVGAEITSFLGTFGIEGGASAPLAPDSTRVSIVRIGTNKELVYDIHGQGKITLCLNGQVEETISLRSIVVTPISAPTVINLLPGNAATCPETPAVSASSPVPVSSSKSQPTAPKAQQTAASIAPVSSSIPASFSLRNYNSTYCLGISGGDNDAPAVQWDCTGPQNQIWRLGNEDGSTGYYQIINGNDQCLGVYTGDTSEGETIVGWDCLGTSHPDQYWRFVKYGNSSYYYLVNYNSGQVVGVWDNSAAEGASIVQWPNQNMLNNQLWKPVDPPS